MYHSGVVFVVVDKAKPNINMINHHKTEAADITRRHETTS